MGTNVLCPMILQEHIISTYRENARVKSASLEERLQAMLSEQVISFAAGCAEHVLRHFIAVLEAAVSEEAISHFITRCKEAQEQC